MCRVLDRRADHRSSLDAARERISAVARRHAVMASFGAHAVLALVVARAHWIEAPPAVRAVIASGWIVLPPTTVAPADEPPPASDVAAAVPPPEPQSAAAPQPEAQAAAPEPEPRPAAAPQPAAPPPARAQRAEPGPPVPPTAAPSSAPSVPEQRTVPAPPRTDWEAERRRALAALSIEGAHKRDFSAPTAPPADDDFGRHGPPTGAIFDPHAADGSALAPGQARTRLGNALRGACNALMGGFSILGFGRFCADSRPTNYLILDVRPDYLLGLPECTDVAADAPQFEARDGIPFRSAKCKLVPKEWRARTGAADR
jgi:hypothetical protein